MSKYIGLKEYDGTLERKIALVLDHNIIFSRDNSFVFLDKGGISDLTEKLISAIKDYGRNAARQQNIDKPGHTKGD